MVVVIEGKFQTDINPSLVLMKGYRCAKYSNVIALLNSIRSLRLAEVVKEVKLEPEDGPILYIKTKEGAILIAPSKAIGVDVDEQIVKKILEDLRDLLQTQ